MTRKLQQERGKQKERKSASYEWNASKATIQKRRSEADNHAHSDQKFSTSFSVYVKICRIPMVRSHIFYFHGPFHLLRFAEI